MSDSHATIRLNVKELRILRDLMYSTGQSSDDAGVAQVARRISERADKALGQIVMAQKREGGA